tara:strand:- start:82 stop:258 length:177 start_codon:yes stop_codon:yes gene_type:complete
MRVGDLVKVKLKRREDTLGLVVEVKQDDSNRIIIVQPVNPGLQVYANPVDVEVISESR